MVRQRRKISVIGQVLDAQRGREIHRLPSRTRANGRNLYLVVLAALQTVEDVIAVVRGVIIGPGSIRQNAIADGVAVVGKTDPCNGCGIGGDAVYIEVIDRGTLGAVENGDVIHRNGAAAGLLGKESELDVIGTRGKRYRVVLQRRGRLGEQSPLVPTVGGTGPVIDAKVIGIVGAVVGGVFDGDVGVRDHRDVEHGRHDTAGVRSRIHVIVVKFSIRPCPRMPRIGG